MQYINLRAEMARKEITVKELAKNLKKSTGKISKNLNGSGGDFTVGEALFIQENFFPECEISYLFRRE